MKKDEVHNLQVISLIDWSSSHPMCLWAAAKSYVSPAVCSTQATVVPPTADFGNALYGIDLRSNVATCLWSPSGNEFLTEGVASISGLMTDWRKDHCLWIRSISAGKTWELDFPHGGGGSVNSLRSSWDSRSSSG